MNLFNAHQSPPFSLNITRLDVPPHVRVIPTPAHENSFTVQSCSHSGGALRLSKCNLMMRRQTNTHTHTVAIHTGENQKLCTK